MGERVRITVEFEMPQCADLVSCADHVLRMLRASDLAPPDPGEGCQYVCYDRTLRIVKSETLATNAPL